MPRFVYSKFHISKESRTDCGMHFLQGKALYAAEADRIRNWAENRTRFSFTDATEMYTEDTWVSVFSLSVVCAFIILSSTSSNFPGT